MASGIYLLNFSGNAYYIGKSNDIERRWKEHTTKFQKGTAAKAMQEAYNRYGLPEFRVHVECHEDHADLIESISIEHNRHLLINTTQPKLISEEDRVTLLSNGDFLQLSTAEHIRLLIESNTQIEQEQNKTKNAVARKEAECYRANKEVVQGLEDSLKELTSNFDTLEIAYDALLNRDEFIVDLLKTTSIKEERIREQYSQLEWSKVRETKLREDIKKLKSRTLWERICNK